MENKNPIQHLIDQTNSEEEVGRICMAFQIGVRLGSLNILEAYKNKIDQDIERTIF